MFNDFIGIKYLRHVNVMQCALHLYIFVCYRTPQYVNWIAIYIKTGKYTCHIC